MSKVPNSQVWSAWNTARTKGQTGISHHGEIKEKRKIWRCAHCGQWWDNVDGECDCGSAIMR